MKLRCTHNSIRLRLRKSDIDSLRQNASVSEKVNLGNQVVFSFSLSIDSKVDQPLASFEQQTLAMRLPLDLANNWMDTQEVGIESFLPLEGEEQLHLLIEKDFPCIDRENENKEDTYWELVEDKSDAC